MKSNYFDQNNQKDLNKPILHHICFDKIDGGFDKKKIMDINLWEQVKIGDEQMLLLGQFCDDQINTIDAQIIDKLVQVEANQSHLDQSLDMGECFLINMEIEHNQSIFMNQQGSQSEQMKRITPTLSQTQENNLLNYNQKLIKKSKRRKIQGKNRYPDLFLPRFKWAIKRKLERSYFKNKTLRIQDLNKLPGMVKPSMNNMIDLLEIEDLFSSGVPSRSLSQQYTSSNQILLDALFPLPTSSGILRKKRIQKESTWDFLRFFSSYQIISKMIKKHQIPRQDLTFQNCRYYNLVTTLEYNQFEEDK